jgi:hypothetical protein
MCIDKTYPSFRFFARNDGEEKSRLDVEVLWWESGASKHSKIKLDKKAGDSWAPVKSVKLPENLLETSELEPVQFRFSVTGAGGAWQVDDVYVDPWARR